MLIGVCPGKNELKFLQDMKSADDLVSEGSLRRARDELGGLSIKECYQGNNEYAKQVKIMIQVIDNILLRRRRRERIEDSTILEENNEMSKM